MAGNQRGATSLQPELDVIPEPAPAPVAATAHAMIGMLRRHYLPDETRPAGIFAPEIQAPGPTQRRADLIWLGCTAAAGSTLVGHEVNVTRGDVLNELADLTKSDPWQKYCDRWYLVVPHLSLIAGLELPESWGVMLPPSGRRTRSMTVHRPAPALRPAEQAPALKTLAAWQHWRLRDAHLTDVELRKRLERVERERRELELSAPRHLDPRRDVVGQIVGALGGHYVGESIGTWKHQVKVDDVVAALKDLGAVYARRDEALRTLEGARGGLKTYREMATATLAAMDKAGS